MHRFVYTGVTDVYMYRYGQGDRPVASVRPMMSNLRPQGGASNLHSRLVNQAPGLKPGVSVQQIQTTQGMYILRVNVLTKYVYCICGPMISYNDQGLYIRLLFQVYCRHTHD